MPIELILSEEKVRVLDLKEISPKILDRTVHVYCGFINPTADCPAC